MYEGLYLPKILREDKAEIRKSEILEEKYYAQIYFYSI